MKQILIGILVAIASLFMCLDVTSQTPVETPSELPADVPNILTALDSTAGVTIVLPAELASRLERSTATAVAKAEATPSMRPQRQVYFRVEVFADNGRNAKAQAGAKRRNVQSRFPQYPASLAFDSPFWRVRVGEFRSRGDAESALAEIRNAFPSYSPYLRIVRD